MKGGIIAIKLREDDELVDVVVTKPGDEVVLATASGMAIRFSEADARPMGRNTSGVKGISSRRGDALVGMVVADPDATLLTACENGYGKRTPFGPNSRRRRRRRRDRRRRRRRRRAAAERAVDADDEGDEDEAARSGSRYRTQRRGGKGLRDIKTTDRNGPVIGIVRVDDDDELLMMTARGKIQRIAAGDISVIGRNTQGVRIMTPRRRRHAGRRGPRAAKTKTAATRPPAGRGVAQQSRRSRHTDEDPNHDHAAATPQRFERPHRRRLHLRQSNAFCRRDRGARLVLRRKPLAPVRQRRDDARDRAERRLHRHAPPRQRHPLRPSTAAGPAPSSRETRSPASFSASAGRHCTASSTPGRFFFIASGVVDTSSAPAFHSCSAQ